MEKLKELREKQGLSYQKLSDKSGVAASYICSLENGEKKNPSLKVMIKLADALGVNVTNIIGG